MRGSSAPRNRKKRRGKRSRRANSCTASGVAGAIPGAGASGMTRMRAGSTPGSRDRSRAVAAETAISRVARRSESSICGTVSTRLRQVW